MEERLTIVPDELQAEMVRSVLEAHGIHCVVRRPALGQLQWGDVNPGMGGPREIIVRGDELAAARELLDSPVEGVPVAAAAPDARLVARSRGLRSGFSLLVLVLFGVPLAAAGLLALLATLDRLG
jgi:hypothetical protein